MMISNKNSCRPLAADLDGLVIYPGVGVMVEY
jgi:hypothetical protein